MSVSCLLTPILFSTLARVCCLRNCLCVGIINVLTAVIVRGYIVRMLYFTQLRLIINFICCLTLDRIDQQLCRQVRKLSVDGMVNTWGQTDKPNCG